MIKLFWPKPEKYYKHYKEEVKKLVALDQNVPFDIGSMEFTLYDLLGKKYYSFPESTAIPMERLAKIEEFKVWMSCGLHAGSIELICEQMEKILSDGIKNGKGTAQIGLLISELRTRKEMSIPIELFYNYLAVQLVREDEKPEVFNNQIHLEKIVALQDMTKETGSFFFGLKELKMLRNWSDMSEDEWDSYWANSIKLHQNRLQALMTVLQEKS